MGSAVSVPDDQRAKFDALNLTDNQKSSVTTLYNERKAAGDDNAKIEAQIQELIASSATEMPDKSYASVSEIVAEARSSGVTGLLDLGCHAANPGDDLPEGLLSKNGLQWGDDPWEIGQANLQISGLRIKQAFLTSTSLANGITTLTSLDMSEAEITTIDPAIGDLVNLEELNLSENSIKELPPTIGKLTKMTTLIMFKNNLMNLPKELGDCAALEEVNFFNNKILKADCLCELGNLTELNLGGNKLKGIKSCDKWTAMEKLSIHQNMLMNNPELMRVLPSFAPMVKLQFLKMDMNKTLSDLPDFGTGMSEIEHLEINNCQIETAEGKGIDKMPALKTFNCQGNQIAAMPDMSGLAALDTLNMSSNSKLAAAPAGLEKCTNLRVLFLNGTGITSLHDGLANHTKFERVMIPTSFPADSAAEGGIKKVCETGSTDPKAEGKKAGWLKRV